MKALIVEDEPLAAERLISLIHRYDREIEILDTLDSIEDTINFIAAGQPVDVLLLDIHLADGLSFELFKQIKVETPVIFTTAYDQYAIQAFKLNSVDYLLKPIIFEELVQAFDKLKKQQIQPLQLDIDTLKQLTEPKKYQERFISRVGDKIQVTKADHVAFFFADGKTVYLKNQENQKQILDLTLDKLERQLLDPQRFFRINRKAIINADAIKEIRNYVNSRLRITLSVPSEEDLIVSREKVTIFKNWLNQ